MHIKTIFEFGTPEYDQSVRLRDDVLRKPLGLQFQEADLAMEYDSFHLGIFDENQEILATLIMKPIDDQEVKMRQVAVSPTLQGSGLGRDLVHFSETWAKRKGFSIITLHARMEAVPFYQKQDYHIKGDPFVEVGIEHYAMYKNIK